MERREVLKKNVHTMFLVRDLYDITTYEGMKETYSQNIKRIWIELAMTMANQKSAGLSDTELEIMGTFKDVKYTDTESILEHTLKFKKMKFDIINILGL